MKRDMDLVCKTNNNENKAGYINGLIVKDMTKSVGSHGLE